MYISTFIICYMSYKTHQYFCDLSPGKLNSIMAEKYEIRKRMAIETARASYNKEKKSFDETIAFKESYI